MSRTDKKLLDELLALLVRVIGESVKDKLLRAVLIGVIASVGSYTAMEGPAEPEVVDPFVYTPREFPTLKFEPGSNTTKVETDNKVEFPEAK